MKKNVFNHGHILQILGIIVIIINAIHSWANLFDMWIYAGLIPSMYEFGICFGEYRGWCLYGIKNNKTHKKT